MGRGRQESNVVEHRPQTRRTVRTIERLIERDGATCVWCSRELSLDASERQGIPSREHLLPQVAGGGDSLDNLAIACMPCNGARKSIPFIAYANLARANGQSVRMDVLERALNRMLSSQDTRLVLAAALECSRLLETPSADALRRDIERRVDGLWRARPNVGAIAKEVVDARLAAAAKLEQIRQQVAELSDLDPASFSVAVRRIIEGEDQVIAFLLYNGKEVEALHRLERAIIPLND